jgi:CxxC motif-containing protein (DUF1111 family)
MNLHARRTIRGIVLAGGAPAALLLGSALWPAEAQRPLAPGDPLPGLTPVEFEEFRLGLDDFLEVETSEEGLGPAYNGTSCGACHNVPAVGGVSPVAEVRAARRLPSGEHEPLDPFGESLFQLFSVPGHACQATIPEEANVIARRVPVPLFGAGLVEAIDDSTILAREDPLDADGDGVSGRAAIVIDRGSGQPRVGRFGWKAQHATLVAFGADAYRNEMGITNALFPDEVAAGVDLNRMALCDPIPDPEDIEDPRTRRRGIDNFASFMRLLAPIARAPEPGAAAGEALFVAAGCVACHVPALVTGANPNPLFDRQPVPLFSDLLLHDIGTGDGIPQASADPDEIRTPALWGLRVRRPLLHDGSAATIDDAIRRHRGEAERARAAFDALHEGDQGLLLAFLKSL